MPEAMLYWFAGIETHHLLMFPCRSLASDQHSLTLITFGIIAPEYTRHGAAAIPTVWREILVPAVVLAVGS